MDILIDSIFVSLLVISSSLLLMPLQDNDFRETYTWVYNNMVLESFLNSEINNTKVSVLVSELLCNENQEVYELVSPLVGIKQGMNYILYSSLNSNELWLYNKQKTVCLERLILNKFNMTTLCGQAEILFGIWHDDEPGPEAC